MNLSKTVVIAMILSALMFSLSACEEQGPLEEAGEEIDDAARDTGDAIEDATDGN